MVPKYFQSDCRIVMFGEILISHRIRQTYFTKRKINFPNLNISHTTHSLEEPLSSPFTGDHDTDSVYNPKPG